MNKFEINDECRSLKSSHRRSDGIGELSSKDIGHPVSYHYSRLFQTCRVTFLRSVQFTAVTTGVAGRSAGDLV